MSESLSGLRVVEIDLGTSLVGAGLASCLPGALLRDLGAQVVRVQASARSTLDAGVQFARVWNRGKTIAGEAEAAALAASADVVIASGPEALIEQRGLGWGALSRANPRLVHVRIRPSLHDAGALDDLELLVAARAGLLTQIRHPHGARPAFSDTPIAQAGAALSATVGALAKLFEREATGVGGWVETSLYDGLAAMLPMIIGRVEHHSPSTSQLWKEQGPDAGLVYRCADGQYLQLWFGAKGAYEAFLARVGDAPTRAGYIMDIRSGEIAARSERWAAQFATRARALWLQEFAGERFRCEPVLRPGEALDDPHLRETGLSVELEGPTTRALGPVLRVRAGGGTGSELGTDKLLAGVKVLDLSAYLAGPVAPLVLAELGADVVKIEPPTGDAHRAFEPLYAAGQRGKRAVALDLKAPDASAQLARLFRWSDVVHHNSRVGLAETLGYDEPRARAAQPSLVYSFASGFGEHGPRAKLPCNDYLMQALCGVEAAQAGFGEAPRSLAWGAVDVAGGWLAACGILAGLYARRRTGAGQSVSSSLLGAGMLLKSGAFRERERSVVGPSLDGALNGYGAAYRIYRCAQGWLALAVPDAAAWGRLRSLVQGLPELAPALRLEGGDVQPEERVLEAAFATRSAQAWARSLASARVPAEVVAELDRTAFASRFVDDPLNQQLGRVTRCVWGERGRLEQPTFPPRVGPVPRPGARAGIPSLGEHTEEVLAAV